MIEQFEDSDELIIKITYVIKKISIHSFSSILINIGKNENYNKKRLKYYIDQPQQ